MAVEVFSVVFGVLLALGLNEWRSVRSADARAAAAIANIRQEILANRTMLERIHSNNVIVVEALISGSADADTLAFIPGSQLGHAAWDAARTAGAMERVEYDVLLSLSSLYTLQGVYRNLARQFTGAVMSGSSYAAATESDVKADDIIRRLSWVMDLPVEAEEGLLRLSGTALDEIGAEA